MTNQCASNEPYITVGSSISYSEIKDYYYELRDNKQIRDVVNLQRICRRLRVSRDIYDDSLEDVIPELFQEIGNLSCSPFQEVFKAWNEGRLTFCYSPSNDLMYYIDRFIIDNYINGGNIYMVYIDINNRLSMSRFDKTSNPRRKKDSYWFTYLMDHMKYVKYVCDNKALNYNNSYYNTKVIFKHMFDSSNKDWKKEFREYNYMFFEDLNDIAVSKLKRIMNFIPDYEIEILDIVSIVQNRYNGLLSSDDLVGKIIYSLSKLASEGQLRKVIKMEEPNNE